MQGRINIAVLSRYACRRALATWESVALGDIVFLTTIAARLEKQERRRP
jgi:hypothetical protein